MTRATGAQRLRRTLAAFATAATMLAAMLVFAGPTQNASAAETPALPDTVSADALPTWQINGVVWSQAVVGNTVYVTGSFTKARPPGVAVGGAGEIDANNIFAFDIRTGNPVANFAHSMDAQGLVVRGTPDGKTVYFGGDFTTVDGQARAHVAAFDVATGALLDWAPRADGQVRGFAFAGDTVYVGGNFRSSGGKPRSELAAWNTTTKAITDWAPSAGGDGFVWDMVMSPDSSRVIIGGSFTELNGAAVYGMASLEASSGNALAWAATDRIRTAGLNGAISSLSTDGVQVYGTAYAFGTGATFEGTFAADPYTGGINWVNDCLGDSYASFPQGQVLYSVSHRHDCSVIGGFPDTNPRSRWQKATAEPTFPTGITTKKDAYGWDYTGIPYTGLLHWYPDLEFGSYTSARQAAWSVTGNSEYIVLGGEFPKVNNVAQQGLVRFAKRTTSPHAVGPINSAGFTPAPYSDEAGVVRIPFSSVWDRDNAAITYDVFRSPATKIATFTRTDSEFWKLPSLSATDTGQTPGSQVRYQVRAKDADGNVQWSAWSPYITVSGTPTSAYRAAVRASGATHYWRLGETTGTRFADDVGDAPGSSSTLTLGANGALTNDGDKAVTSAGGSNPKMTTQDAVDADAAVSVEAWVKTTSSRGGRIVGFGDSAAGTSTAGNTDRVLYLDSSGRANFAINDGSYRTVFSRTSINDGQWHHIVGTVGSEGMQLFVDGDRVGRDQSYTAPKSHSGYWRIGADQTSGFTNRPTDMALSGTIDDVAVYAKALPKSDVQAHYLASGRAATWTAAPTDTYGAAVSADTPDLYWRLNETTSGTIRDSAVGGTTGNLAGTVTRNVTGAVTGDSATTFNGTNAQIVAQEAWNAPSAYSAELWFKSTSNKGGTLIGFGNTTSGLSSNTGSIDRQVTMQSNGKLVFGANNGTQTTIATSTAFNDGQWHHVVATQGSAGMKFWVDSQLIGSNGVTGALNQRGYWRIGADRTWGGTTSNYLAGTLDEVAVYPVALSGDRIRAHFAAAGRTPANQAPTAAFTPTMTNLGLAVDASASADQDGTITGYAWTFGDGETGTGATASHTYAAAGTYTVTLTVTDDSGASASTTRSVTATEPVNQLPTAAFTATSDQRDLSVDGSASADPDGTVASYAWDFGDSTTGTGATATHTYAQTGTYTVRLTVTDNRGGTHSVTQDVVITQNAAPTAAFTSAVTDLSAAFDGSGSSDPDGAIASYAWDFGDSTTGTGATATHAYAAAGTYTVTLEVKDNRGASATTTAQVTVTAPAVWATDTFDRTATNGWGNSGTSGSWTMLPGTTTALSKFSVADGVGKVTLSAGNNYTAVLAGSTPSANTEERYTVAFNQPSTGGGYYFSAIGRQIDSANDYRAKFRVAANGTVALWLTKTVAGTETVLASTTVSGLTVTGPDSLNVRFQVTGTNATTLKAKVWRTGTTEPTAWASTITDSTAVLQAPGYVGVNSYLSSSATTVPLVYSYDNLWAGPAQ
ncbi:PKD domain-containing protein [Microbacterium sp. SSW1-49]|uniref:PKD domain-containing protein n=1 Tax=Microbacterium croceum TaxID=2851645 RepID=A0ABT0FC04_9MICO|nr:PKD domain-containing protein [Microbacterium croceum]MCK2035589.1 PKD domain-containing protein [Microbacterium croceum]